MKKLLLLLICLFQLSGFTTNAQTSLTVFDEILFYDGYAPVVDFPTPEGVIRHRNDLYAKKLTTDQLQAFGNTMTINVIIKAACDNYDRIGNVNLAFVPIGATTYVPADVQRIELARFITPFMNKNIAPTEVPYTFSADNVAQIFKDTQLLGQYDIWVEFEVFGVPYAAQTQVAGCSGRNDVFYGTLEFVSNADPVPAGQNYLQSLNFKKDLNNYAAGASDAIGTTARTINFNVPVALTNAKFHLITSNHGANAGGEEYNRRFHHIYYDGPQVLLYKPGGVSCEPYRIYNTQGNGIYGPTPRSDAEWASFSNWCPGQVIPIRVINIGNMAAGDHIFKITVPTAVFVGGEGYIPVSVYLQGTEETLGVDEQSIVSYSIFPNPAADYITIQSATAVKSVEIYNTLGQLVSNGKTEKVDVSQLQKGIYMLRITFDGNSIVTEKIIKE